MRFLIKLPKTESVAERIVDPLDEAFRELEAAVRARRLRKLCEDRGRHGLAYQIFSVQGLFCCDCGADVSPIRDQ